MWSRSTRKTSRRRSLRVGFCSAPLGLARSPRWGYGDSAGIPGALDRVSLPDRANRPDLALLGSEVGKAAG